MWPNTADPSTFPPTSSPGEDGTLLHSFLLACRRIRQLPTPQVLLVNVRKQQMWLFARMPAARAVSGSAATPADVRPLLSSPLSSTYTLNQIYRISTSRFGIGQQAGSNQTPLGLHRIAQKIGAGYPAGTAFESRKAIGSTWDGLPDAPIVHRILWLEGLEPGFNSGPGVDTFQRYIYIHGTSHEENLGRPASQGCIHLAAKDLLPLFDRLPLNTLLWIDRG